MPGVRNKWAFFTVAGFSGDVHKDLISKLIFKIILFLLPNFKALRDKASQAKGLTTSSLPSSLPMTACPGLGGKVEGLFTCIWPQILIHALKM